jgi:FkbM family methyltransferase
MTLSCRDTNSLPKVADAGQVRDHPAGRVQVMHNGLLVIEGCYYGPWMTRIIRGLAGHHEPQEEAVFDAVVRRLAASGPAAPTMIEFGSFWAYYAMWFCRALPGGRALAMEPDPVYLQVGARNAKLNDLMGRIDFVHGAVGARPGEIMQFRAESTGEPTAVVQHDLASLMTSVGWQRVDLALLDIQGAETVLLDRAGGLLRAGAVRFLIVSTHHQSISGDALTHQKALDLIAACGGSVIAEHTVRESYSGDGLIAASFDPGDRDLSVTISRARARDSLFGEPEYEIAALLNRLPPG